MLPSHFGWPHSTQPRRVSSVLTCLYRYCKGSASSGMTIPDCSCFIFSRFAAVGSLCRIVVRMRHRFLWSPMMLAWMYYTILYDIIWYSMILYDILCCMYPNIGSNCLRGCIHAWQMYTTITYYSKKPSTRSSNTIPLLARGRAMNETCRWRQKSRNSRDLRTRQVTQACRDWYQFPIACIQTLCI